LGLGPLRGRSRHRLRDRDWLLGLGFRDLLGAGLGLRLGNRRRGPARGLLPQNVEHDAGRIGEDHLLELEAVAGEANVSHGARAFRNHLDALDERLVARVEVLGGGR
jgi:hypothetical protein